MDAGHELTPEGELRFADLCDRIAVQDEHSHLDHDARKRIAELVPPDSNEDIETLSKDRASSPPAVPASGPSPGPVFGNVPRR